MQEQTFDEILSIIKSDFHKIFVNSSSRILKAIQVATGAQFRKSGGLPIWEQLTIRSGGLVRDLQSDEQTKVEDEGDIITASKKLKSEYAFLLTDEKQAVTDKQRALFRFFAFREKGSSNKEWRDYWGKMGNRHKGVRFLYGRKHVESAIDNFDIAPIIKSEVESAYPNKTKVVIIQG